MEWILVESGEEIRKASIIGVGPVKSVKVSSGKGETLIERTVYNFYIRIGTGGVIVKSCDYVSEQAADRDRFEITS